MNSYQMVLHRPVETAPLSGKFETESGALVVEVAAPYLGNYGFMVGQTAI